MTCIMMFFPLSTIYNFDQMVAGESHVMMFMCKLGNIVFKLVFILFLRLFPTCNFISFSVEGIQLASPIILDSYCDEFVIVLNILSYVDLFFSQKKIIVILSFYLT